MLIPKGEKTPVWSLLHCQPTGTKEVKWGVGGQHPWSSVSRRGEPGQAAWTHSSWCCSARGYVCGAGKKQFASQIKWNDLTLSSDVLHSPGEKKSLLRPWFSTCSRATSPFSHQNLLPGLCLPICLAKGSNQTTSVMASKHCMLTKIKM